MVIDIDAFRDEFETFISPEGDADSSPYREFPNKRLSTKWSLKFPYMETFDWEGSTSHKHTRLCPAHEERVQTLTKSRDISGSLFLSAFRLIADSVVEYISPVVSNNLRFYPPAILTFWAGFESYVRHASELFLATALEASAGLADFLREQHTTFDRNGNIRVLIRTRPVLDRYAVFLKHAYGYELDWGSPTWQGLEAAKRLRDYYTHLDAASPRSISSREVLDFMEFVLLALIVPSSVVQRTLMLGQYWMYDIWEFLCKNVPDRKEQPFFLDWTLHEDYHFHCNFEGVDDSRFPSVGKNK